MAGAVALLKAAYPDTTGPQIRRALFEGANGNYCKEDKNEFNYEVLNNHTTDYTSKYGFLDVKAVYDILQEIIVKDDKNTFSGFAVLISFSLILAVLKE